MVFVFGFVANTNKNQHHDVGGEIGQGVYGIGYHGGTVAQNACREFESHQQGVDKTAP